MFFLLFAAVGLALMFAPPRVRNAGLVVVGVIFLIFLATVLIYRQPPPETHPAPGQPKIAPNADSRRFDFDQYERDKKDKEDPEAKTRIALTEVHFDQIQAIAGIEPGTLRSVQARLYNDSRQYTLTDYTYYLVIQDCLAAKPNDKSGEQCTAVYDQRDSVSLNVPPNQARDVVIPIPKNATGFAAPFKLLGTPHIELTASDTRAYRPTTSPP